MKRIGFLAVTALAINASTASASWLDSLFSDEDVASVPAPEIAEGEVYYENTNYAGYKLLRGFGANCGPCYGWHPRPCGHTQKCGKAAPKCTQKAACQKTRKCVRKSAPKCVQKSAPKCAQKAPCQKTRKCVQKSAPKCMQKSAPKCAQKSAAKCVQKHNWLQRSIQKCTQRSAPKCAQKAPCQKTRKCTQKSAPKCTQKSAPKCTQKSAPKCTQKSAPKCAQKAPCQKTRKCVQKSAPKCTQKSAPKCAHKHESVKGGKCKSRRCFSLSDLQIKLPTCKACKTPVKHAKAVSKCRRPNWNLFANFPSCGKCKGKSKSGGKGFTVAPSEAAPAVESSDEAADEADLGEPPAPEVELRDDRSASLRLFPGSTQLLPIRLGG